jgi:hypothetical protein
VQRDGVDLRARQLDRRADPLEVLAVDPLHEDVRHARGRLAADVVDLDGVVRAKVHADVRLVVEASPVVTLEADLDRDPAVLHHIVALPDLAHAALARLAHQQTGFQQRLSANDRAVFERILQHYRGLDRSAPSGREWRGT